MHTRGTKSGIRSILLFLVLLTNVGRGQIEPLVESVAGKNEYQFQREVEQKAKGDIATYRQFLADSLRLLYSELLEQKLDSLASDWNIQNAALQEEVTRLEATNKKLRDSLQVLRVSQSVSPVPSSRFDTQVQTELFQYLKLLKAETNKQKGGLIKGQLEDIFPYQIEELQDYYQRYYPAANTDSVLDFMCQLWIRNGDWTKAELAILKFIYLFSESPLFAEVKNVRTGIFQTEKYYRPYQAFLTDLLNNLPNYPTLELRYFHFVELLKDFPDPAIKAYFIPEARRFLALYPRSPQAPTVSLWIADTFLAKEQPHSAFLWYLRTIIFYPAPEYYQPALFACARIQQEKFNEYESAIQTFTDYFTRFPSDSARTMDARYRIANIYDRNLKNWEKAIAAYQVYADRYPQSDLAAKALMRIAEIQQNELKKIDDAVATLKEFQKRYPQESEAPNALITAGDLLVKKLLFESAIGTYRQVFEIYPQSTQAAIALGKIMDLYATKIKDDAKSLEIAQLLVANYPNTKSGAKADKLIKKLEKVK